MWKRLNFEDLQKVLAYDEYDKLNNMSLESNIKDICQQILDNVSDMFRGAFLGKGYLIDIRDHYIPQSYFIPVLNYARYQIWTRFPNSANTALDEPRKLAYEEAKELLKDPYIGTEEPDYSDDPELSGDTSLNNINDGSITLPYQRIISQPYKYGFKNPYINDYQD